MYQCIQKNEQFKHMTPAQTNKDIYVFDECARAVLYVLFLDPSEVFF